MIARLIFRRVAFTLTLLMAVALCLPGTAFAQDKDQQVQETSLWMGTLDAGARKLLFKIEFVKDDDAWKGTLHSPDEAHIEIPVTKMEISDSELTFELPMVAATFAGKLNDDQTVATGTWTQRKSDFDLELKRVESLELPQPIEFWKGKLEIRELSLDMGLKIFEEKDGNVFAKLYSYSQGGMGTPVKFERDGSNYIITQSALRVKYEGTLGDTGKKLTGTFQQAGIEGTLNMEKVPLDDEHVYVRPQHPEPPFPYNSEDVKYENRQDKVTLGGTLTLPRGDGPFPAAILISGSGSQDRDETIFGHKPFWVIADHLTRQGFAVLRFDDRGVGESTGADILAKSTTEDFARDVQAGIDYLKGRQEINASNIGLIGHSEGGMIAPIVATTGNDVAFIISLAGPGVVGARVLSSQTRAALEAAGLAPEYVEANTKIMDAGIEMVMSGEGVTAQEITEKCSEIAAGFDEKVADELKPGMQMMSALLTAPWTKYFLHYDPAPVWQKVKCPVLAMNGEKDLQVLVDLNLNAIEKALKEGGNQDFRILRMPNMNHMFQETDGPGLGSEYGQLEQTFSPKALEAIGDWLEEVVK